MLPEPHERARLLWRARGRPAKPPARPAEPDWRCLHMVWPHHTLRGEDWTAVAFESQPTAYRKPLRSGISQGISVLGQESPEEGDLRASRASHRCKNAWFQALNVLVSGSHERRERLSELPRSRNQVKSSSFAAIEARCNGVADHVAREVLGTPPEAGGVTWRALVDRS